VRGSSRYTTQLFAMAYARVSTREIPGLAPAGSLQLRCKRPRSLYASQLEPIAPMFPCLRYLRIGVSKGEQPNARAVQSPFVSKSRTVRWLALSPRDVARVDEGKHVSQQLIWDGVRLDELLLG
jgi:hypothetical protein